MIYRQGTGAIVTQQTTEKTVAGTDDFHVSDEKNLFATRGKFWRGIRTGEREATPRRLRHVF